MSIRYKHAIYFWLILISINVMYISLAKMIQYVRNVSKNSNYYLFIINYHWSEYENFGFINSVYIPYIKRTFKCRCRFVFYGPNKSDIYPIKSNGLKEGGYYSYYSIVKAYYEENRNYSGYFLLNDDSFFDPLVLYKKGFDLTKPIIEGIVIKDRNLSQWYWPGFINYRNITFRQAYLNFREIICEKKSFYGRVYSDSKLCKFTKKINICGYADFVYIPQQYILVYVYLLDLAYREGMFLEMAVNTVAYMFDYVELGGRCFEIGKCLHIHPVKYSLKENRKIVRDYINKIQP